ncbi:MAG: hypothetical protein WCJ24_02935 [Candidatus Saccharibacteria bacterium]
MKHYKSLPNRSSSQHFGNISANDAAKEFQTHPGNVPLRFTLMDREASIGSDLSLKYAGKMAIELAYQIDDSETRLQLLDSAQKHLEASKARKAFGLTGASGNAAVELALLPQHRYSIMLGKVARPKVMESIYLDLLEAGQEHKNALAGNVHPLVRQDLKGNLSEISTLMLLQRFAVQEGDGSWSILPASLSSDRGKANRGSHVRNSWDIEVQTQYDLETPPELQYKIQVKTRRHANKTHFKRTIYAEDIAVVYVQDDLQINGQIMPLDQIINECIAEQEGDEVSAQKLNRRTGRLLDILG